jgi:predicted kinase
MATLHLVCGLPGSGKTTLAKSLEQVRRAVRLCPDEWLTALFINLRDEDARARVETLQWRLGRKLLGLGVDVVVEWGSWGASEREKLRNEALWQGAQTELYLLDPPLAVLWERVRERRMEDPPCTREELEKSAALFQRPEDPELATYHKVHIDPKLPFAF